MSQQNDVNAQETPAAEDCLESQLPSVDKAMLNRRKVLKVAVLATPMLLTLRAKSVYAGGGHVHHAGCGHDTNEPDYVAYGPGAYIDNEPDSTPPKEDYNPPYVKPKKKPWWQWW